MHAASRQTRQKERPRRRRPDHGDSTGRWGRRARWRPRATGSATGTEIRDPPPRRRRRRDGVLVGEHGSEVGQVALQESRFGSRPRGDLCVSPWARMPARRRPSSAPRSSAPSGRPSPVWNQISGALRHRRDIVPVAASARWRGGSRGTQSNSLVDLHTGRHDVLVVFLAHGCLEGVPVDLGVVRGQVPGPT